MSHEPQPPEKERDRPGDRAAPNSSNEQHEAFTTPGRVKGTVRGFGLEDGRTVPTVDGIAATQDWDAEAVESVFTEDELVTRALRTAALDRYLGRDGRSFAEIAAELGVTRAAVSWVYRDVVERLGGWKLYERAAWRSRLSSATSASWPARKSKKNAA